MSKIEYLGAVLAGGLLAASPVHAASESVLYAFQGTTDGGGPQTGLTKLDGTLYGTTYQGGANNQGVVFSLTPAGAQTVLYSFGGGADGSHPYKGSLINVKGTLYGITEAGGSGTACTGGCGTVFSVTPAGVETVLYSFQGGSDGVEPTGLIKVGKNFYGTTYGGGTGSFGTVFKLTLTKTGGATETVLHSFQGSDGKFPYGGLINVGGTLYGTTWLGGAAIFGTVYKITTAGDETVLHSFGGSDGQAPIGGLTNFGGTLYGTTSNGGANGTGTVFSVTPAGDETLLYSFQASGSGDGRGPAAALERVGSMLYGTTNNGGSSTACGSGCGTVFKITPAGAESVVYSFQGPAAGDGNFPNSALTHIGKALYGTTLNGGVNGQGTVFAISQFKK